MNYCSSFNLFELNSNDTNGISNNQDILFAVLFGSMPKANPNIGTSSTVILGNILTLDIKTKYIIELNSTHTPNRSSDTINSVEPPYVLTTWKHRYIKLIGKITTNSILTNERVIDFNMIIDLND